MHYPFILIDIDQQSQEWLKWREGKVGASMAPTIMGENPFQSKDALLVQMREKKQKKKTAAMKRGILMEEQAREWLNHHLRIEFRPVCVERMDHSSIISSLDGYFKHDDGTIAICEIKCPGVDAHLSALEGDIPKYYYAQVQHQMDSVGVDSIYYCSFDGEKGTVVECQRERNYCSILLQKELDFLEELNGKSTYETFQGSQQDERV